MFFKTWVAADNKNNRWQKSMPKIKMAAMNRKYTYNTCICGCVIATKFQRLCPCFRGRTTRLKYSEECTMYGLGINQRWLPITGSRYEIMHTSAAIFDFSLFRTSSILRSSLITLIVLPDLENMGIAVGILLLLCIEAEIYVISYIRPVNVSHLWYIPYPYIGHSSEFFSRVAWPRKYRYSRWNFVAIVYRFLPCPHIWPSSW